MAKQGNLLSKTLVIGIIFLFIVMGIVPSSSTIVEKRYSTVLDSPGYIQDLIDNANDGDTINIPSGTYYENIIIDKSISLIGEDKDTTIIDGGGKWDVVFVDADEVYISGFTIRNGGLNGINIYASSNNTISDNIISYNYGDGIWVEHSINNTIFDNRITENRFDGICLLDDSKFNIITGNNISSNRRMAGITLAFASYNTIKNNIISNNDYGIYMHYYYNNFNNKIYHNNFIRNIDLNVLSFGHNNIWDDGKKGNYWSDYEERYPDAKRKPLKGIWDTPYEIILEDNKDNYPLIRKLQISSSKNTPRPKTKVYSLFHLFFDRFPLLEVFLRVMNLLR